MAGRVNLVILAILVFQVLVAIAGIVGIAEFLAIRVILD